MKTWELNKAQKRFKEIIAACSKEPQMICEKDRVLGVLIDVKYYHQLVKGMQRQSYPTIAELLEELDEIKHQEMSEIDIPERKDRPNPILES